MHELRDYGNAADDCKKVWLSITLTLVNGDDVSGGADTVLVKLRPIERQLISSLRDIAPYARCFLLYVFLHYKLYI